MDTAERNYVAALIDRAEHEARTARFLATTFGLDSTAERLTWALEFIDAARAKLPASNGNPDGTTGSARITSEGIELGPPKG